MIDPIPSKWMREYLKQKNHVLTDSEKATMIWNRGDASWTQRLESLQELAAHTTDSTLKKQILERVSFEQEEFRKFLDNSQGEFVYFVDDNTKEIHGFFAKYDTAYEYTLLCINEYREDEDLEHFYIKKQRIWTGTEQEAFDQRSYFARPSVQISFSGEIHYFWTENSLDTAEEEHERFEYQYFDFPCGLHHGCVKLLEKNKYGVAYTTEESFEEYRKHGYDYSDIQVPVYRLTEYGSWWHTHENPLLLEPEEPDAEFADNKKRAMIEAMHAMAAYFEADTDENAKEVVRATNKYTEECSKENFAIINSIKDIFGGLE